MTIHTEAPKTDVLSGLRPWLIAAAKRKAIADVRRYAYIETENMKCMR